MKKKSALLLLAGVVSLLLLLAVFIFPVAPGVIRSITNPSTQVVTREVYRGYDIVLGNLTISGLEASSGSIAAFTLLIIGAVFSALATILVVPNPEGSKKFSGFLFFVAGLCVLMTGILYFCAIPLSELETAANTSYSLGWGMWIASILAIIAAAILLVFGYLAMAKKRK